MYIIAFRFKDINLMYNFINKYDLISNVYSYLKNEKNILFNYSILEKLNVNQLLYLGDLSLSTVSEYNIDEKKSINYLMDEDLRSSLWELTNKDITYPSLQNSFNILLSNLINYEILKKIIIKLAHYYFSDSSLTLFEFRRIFNLSDDEFNLMYNLYSFLIKNKI